jgi:hypothetical protein
MNARLSVGAALLAAAFATGALAQAPAPAAPQSQEAQQRSAREMQKAAMERCESMKDNAQEICEREVEGQKKIAEAEAKVRERDTPKNRLELAEVKAEAEYKVAVQRCDDQVGDGKSACQKVAKATRELAIAKAEQASLQLTVTPAATAPAATAPAAAPAGQTTTLAPNAK